MELGHQVFAGFDVGEFVDAVSLLSIFLPIQIIASM
jgi:hypothetical protein